MLHPILAQLAQATATDALSEPIVRPEVLVGEVDIACGTGDPSPICRWLFEQTGNATLARLAGEVVPTLLQILLILILAYVVVRLARRVIGSAVRRAASESREALSALRRRTPGLEPGVSEEERRVRDTRAERRSATLAAVLSSIAAFTIWLTALVMILSQLDVDIGPLIASAGIAGVALGFGAQSLVKDFLSGMFMLLEDQYGVGDIVDVGEADGVVEAISLRVTRLRDVEGTVWHVPNGEIRRVGNKSQLWSRSLLDIGVAYDTDLERAGELILAVANELSVDSEWDADILEPPELWGVENFGANEIVIRLVMKTRPARQWAVNREFRRRLKQRFDEAGVEIPFPQRTVWLKREE